MNEINISEAVKILRSKNKNIAFIDVRKREKYVQGFAFGSINCEVAKLNENIIDLVPNNKTCLLYTSPSPRDRQKSRMPSSA